MSFDLDCEGQNNNCSVRSLELDGYCFNDFHHQPPNHRLITDIPSAVNVWRNLAAGDLKVTLKDVYLTDNLVVFTISLGTSKSASNHVSSGAVFVNGEQRLGGGSSGEAEGEPYEQTMTFVFYGGFPEAKLGVDWDNVRISFDGLVFAAYEGTDSGYIGSPNGYSWSYVFHNPGISRYDHDDLAPTVDERGIHTFGDCIDIEFANFSSEGDLNYDLIQKSDLLNLYGSQKALWINDEPRGGGGSSVSFDAGGNPETSEAKRFVRTDHFLYQTEDSIHPNALAVWAQSITFEMTCAGTPRTWSQSLKEQNFPMKLVQFVF